MNRVELNETTMKRLVKEALVETLHEQRALLHEVLAEVLEDAGMAEAIRRGRRTEVISREAALGHSRSVSESFVPQELCEGSEAN